MAIFGWIVLFLISVGVTITAIDSANEDTRLYGRITSTTFFLTVVGLILWCVTLSKMPLPVVAN